MVDSSPRTAIFTFFFDCDVFLLVEVLFVTGSFIQHLNYLFPDLLHFQQSSASLLSFYMSFGYPFNSTVLSFQSAFFPLSLQNSFLSCGCYFWLLHHFRLQSIVLSSLAWSCLILLQYSIQCPISLTRTICSSTISGFLITLAQSPPNL